MSASEPLGSFPQQETQKLALEARRRLLLCRAVVLPSEEEEKKKKKVLSDPSLQGKRRQPPRHASYSAGIGTAGR